MTNMVLYDGKYVQIVQKRIQYLEKEVALAGKGMRVLPAGEGEGCRYVSVADSICSRFARTRYIVAMRQFDMR